MSHKKLHIVILAAGKGSRMRSNMPKILHQVAGKSLLGHVIDCSLELNPEQIHVVVGHGKDKVIDAFSTHPELDRLNWVEQVEQLGTGHAVAQALPAIPSDTNVLMLTADVPLITSKTLTAMVKAMSSSALALLTAIVDQPFGLGRITRDDTNGITGIVEQKDASLEQQKINEINSGIICADRNLLGSCLDEIDDNNAQKEFYLTDIVALAAKAGNPILALHPENNAEVNGINSRAQLAEVERLYQKAQAIR